jgi:aminopeptidase N
MSKLSGQDLEEFFEQAFYRAGHPEFEVGYSWDERGKTATLKVRQVQKTDELTPVFKLPCDIVFYVNGERLKFRVLLDSAEQTLTFLLPSKPSVVELDPQRWLLKTLKFEKSLDLLLNQLETSQDAWSRAEAARDLGKLKSNMAVAPLEAAAATEQFWHVKATAVKALGEIGTNLALKALLSMESPKNRRIRRSLAEALGGFEDERARKLLVDMLEKDESPYVRCEAALALAKSWPKGALPHLKNAMKMTSPNETLAEACLDAMGRLEDPSVAQVIKESLAYGKPTRVRIGALRAIKRRGFIHDDEVQALKQIALHDKEFRVRLYLVNELVRSLGDRRFLETVREASRSDRDSRVRRKSLETYYELAASVERSTAVTKLKEEVEELKEENKKLARAAA